MYGIQFQLRTVEATRKYFGTRLLEMSQLPFTLPNTLLLPSPQGKVTRSYLIHGGNLK